MALRFACVVWLALVGVLVVPGAGRAQAGVTVTGVAAGPFSATISWRASAPVGVVVRYGLTGEYGLWTTSSPPARAGRALLTGLEPATTYRFTLAGVSGSLTTAAAPAAPSAAVTANAFVLDGQPVFPRMVFDQCPWAFPASLAAGINLFMGDGCGDPRAQLNGLGGRAYSVLGAGLYGIGGPGLVGFYQQDEADGQGMTAASLPLLPPSSKSHRVTFLTLTSHFFSGAAPLPAGRSIYPALIARAEMIGFDAYPLQSWCRKDALSAVYDAQRELVALAGGKPTYQWIEAAPMGQCGGLDPSPALVRAETWLAIAGGARGIGWFPANWQPDVAAAIGSLSRQIASLAPALLGPEVPVTTTPAGPVRAGARSFDGATYVIAVNPSFSRTQMRITVPGLGSGLVWVLGEGRAVPIVHGSFGDYFRGLAVHIYVAPPAGA